MQKYILQVASSGKADWNKRYEKSNENQLNKEHSYCDWIEEVIKEVLENFDKKRLDRENDNRMCELI